MDKTYIQQGIFDLLFTDALMTGMYPHCEGPELHFITSPQNANKMIHNWYLCSCQPKWALRF